jgi:hypothetical protein
MIRDIIQQQQLRGAALGGRYAMNRQAGRQAGSRCGAARLGWGGWHVGGRWSVPAGAAPPAWGWPSGGHARRPGWPPAAARRVHGDMTHPATQRERAGAWRGRREGEQELLLGRGGCRLLGTATQSGLRRSRGGGWHLGRVQRREGAVHHRRRRHRRRRRRPAIVGGGGGRGGAAPMLGLRLGHGRLGARPHARPQRRTRHTELSRRAPIGTPPQRGMHMHHPAPR